MTQGGRTSKNIVRMFSLSDNLLISYFFQKTNIYDTENDAEPKLGIERVLTRTFLLSFGWVVKEIRAIKCHSQLVAAIFLRISFLLVKKGFSIRIFAEAEDWMAEHWEKSITNRYDINPKKWNKKNRYSVFGSRQEKKGGLPPRHQQEKENKNILKYKKKV